MKVDIHHTSTRCMNAFHLSRRKMSFLFCQHDSQFFILMFTPFFCTFAHRCSSFCSTVAFPEFIPLFVHRHSSCTDRQTILFNIWKNQISGGGEWPQGLQVILPLETQSNCSEETQVELLRRRPTVYKFHIDLHISTKTVQTYPWDISTLKQDMESKRRWTTQLQQPSGQFNFYYMWGWSIK